MYAYNWDAETGGLLLNSSPLHFSKEPRPVYYKELDILGFDRYWNYAKNDAYPYLWAEANNYFYRGRQVAKTKGGSLYTAPEIILTDEPEPDGRPLRFVDVPAMVEKNRDIIEKLAADTIKKIYNTYIEYQNKVDVFYVAFSGGKDSVVVLDLVQRALPHNAFKVLFGDTGMEFPDTYDMIDKVKEICEKDNLDFLRAQSKFTTDKSWKLFGPPAVTNRWCCSVHKTSPQVRLLQELTKKQGFTGMAFTGVRREESLARSEYNDISFGGKHRGQFSCHPIIEWNSAELFLYIYQENLVLNEAYLKGNLRAGCLMCPLSAGKHEFIKQQCYPKEIDIFTKRIKETSGKTEFSDKELIQFIDDGGWRTRKSGRELNFGQDKHVFEKDKNGAKITVFEKNSTWIEWAKTIGPLSRTSENLYTVEYKGKFYQINLNIENTGLIIFTFPNCGNSKDDIKFISLFREVIIKSVYCVNCGVCVANCSTGCIQMNGKLSISDDCCHCLQCHEIYEGCLRYNSIRNAIGGGRTMNNMDRYFSFGIRKNWIDLYFKDEGSSTFWNTDGHEEVPNKKKDAFLNFLKDAEMVKVDKSIAGDKYFKSIPTQFARTLFSLGSDSERSWALMLCNLAYSPEFNWFIRNIPKHERITPDQFKLLLDPVLENDIKGLGKRNINDAFKAILVKTPIGTELGLGIPDFEERVSASGKENIILHAFVRDSWSHPDPLVILYSLYKFAEACKGYYQFTLSRLLDHSVDSDGVSPTEIFGLDRETMERLLNGLTVNCPDFINASFTLNLDNITLNSEKTSADVLTLF